ncbi:MAG: hypothetical protein WBM35_13130, partial [Candidatus Electrothrix sp.]
MPARQIHFFDFIDRVSAEEQRKRTSSMQSNNLMANIMAKVQKRFIGLAALVAVFFLSAVAGWAAIDPSTVQKLVAGDGGWLDSFGHRVSVDGNIAVIGAAVDG